MEAWTGVALLELIEPIDDKTGVTTVGGGMANAGWSWLNEVAGERPGWTRASAGAPNCGMAKPGGGRAADGMAVADPNNPGAAADKPKAVVKVAAAEASVGLKRAESDAGKQIKKYK